MTQIQWGLQDPNAFQRGYEQTSGLFDKFVATQKQNALQAAMRAYATNPADPAALNALARVDPAKAIEFRQTATKARSTEIEAHRENIVAGAQIIRQIKPKDDASWQQALAVAKQAGVDISQVPTNYDPTYVANLIATADAFKPEKSTEAGPTSFMRDAEAAGIKPGTPEFRKAFDMRNIKLIPDGAGGVTVVDPSAYVTSVPKPAPGQGAGPPAVLTDDEWEEGGAGSSGPGGFL